MKAGRLGSGFQPVARLGDDLDVILAESNMRNPARTIDWSSATSTRMLMPAALPAGGAQ